jgi:hypothetical protein
MHRTQPGRAALLGILWATACTGADSSLGTATDTVDDSDSTDTSDVPADTGELAGDTGGPVADPLGCTAADWLDPWARGDLSVSYTPRASREISPSVTLRGHRAPGDLEPLERIGGRSLRPGDLSVSYTPRASSTGRSGAAGAHR